MELKDIYPSFKVIDPWGREIIATARQSIYTRQIVNAGIPGIPLAEETPITRIQFALLVLERIEQLAMEEDAKRNLGG